MFGLFDDAIDKLGDMTEGAIDLAETVGKATIEVAETVVEGAVEKVENFIDDPVGETIDTAIRPVNDTIDVIDWLSEGELRGKAILALGADAVSGMALGELIEWYESTQ